MNKLGNGGGIWWPGMLLAMGIFIGFFIASITFSGDDEFIQGQAIGMKNTVEAFEKKNNN